MCTETETVGDKVKFQFMPKESNIGWVLDFVAERIKTFRIQDILKREKSYKLVLHSEM